MSETNEVLSETESESSINNTDKYVVNTVYAQTGPKLGQGHENHSDKIFETLKEAQDYMNKTLDCERNTQVTLYHTDVYIKNNPTIKNYFNIKIIKNEEVLQHYEINH